MVNRILSSSGGTLASSIGIGTTFESFWKSTRDALPMDLLIEEDSAISLHCESNSIDPILHCLNLTAHLFSLLLSFFIPSFLLFVRVARRIRLPAEVKNVEGSRVLIHYEGWSSRYEKLETTRRTEQNASNHTEDFGPRSKHSLLSRSSCFSFRSIGSHQ